MAVIDNYGQNEQAIIELFSAVFNKAPTPDLIALGGAELAAGTPPGAILDLLFNYPDVPFTAYRASAPTQAFVTALVNQLSAGSSISAEAKAQWVALLVPEVDGFASRGEFAATLVALIEGGEWEEGSDLAALQANLGAKAEAAAASSYDSTATYQGWNGLVSVDQGGEGPAGTQTLTLGQDDLSGSTDYYAPVIQNGLFGALTNTLETGDIIRGAEGSTDNTLRADLIFSGAYGGNAPAPAISAATNNIQNVILRAQADNTDLVGAAQGNASHIDAERFVGVQEWWTDNSRATIQIEDVRTLPEDTLIGVRSTDPFVGFEVYFSPDQVNDRDLLALDSALTLNVLDITNPDSLANVPIDGVKLILDGQTYEVRSEAIAATTTHAAFYAAIETELKAKYPELAGLEFKAGASASIVTIVDPAGKTFGIGSWTFVDNEVPGNGNIAYSQTPGQPELLEQPITTTLVLDDVGRTSQGGVVDIGSLGEGGIAVFDVEVGRSSWVSALESREFLGTGDRHLEVVNVEHLTGATGDLTIGTAVPSTDGRVFAAAAQAATPAIPGTLGSPGSPSYTIDIVLPWLPIPALDPIAQVVVPLVPGTPAVPGTEGTIATDATGLTDVRVLNAEGFMGFVNAGIRLTADSEERYLVGAEEPVTFSYHGGDAGNILTFSIDNDLSADPDFQLEIIGGTADDRFNLEGLQFKQSTTIDGEEGRNTVELTTSTGVATGGNTAAQNSFGSFENIQKLVVAGGGSVQDFTVGNMLGLEEVVIATNGVPGNTTLQHLENGVEVVVSGKNQTLLDSNADQTFGTISLLASAGLEVDVKLDNTARVDGELTVNNLTIDDRTPTDLSATRVLNLESAGRRQVTNEVAVLNAPDVHTFNIAGTQALTTEIVAASSHTEVPAGRSNLTVDASALESTIDLSISSAVVTNVDAAPSRTVSLTGADGDADVLRFEGVIGAPAATLLETTGATTVSGFETIFFGDARNNYDADGVFVGDAQKVYGSFDAVGVTGAEKYVVDNISNDIYSPAAAGVFADTGLELVNLRSGVQVDITSQDADGDVSLRAASASVGNEVNVTLTHGALNSIDTWGTSARDLEVGGFGTINLNLAAGTGNIAGGYTEVAHDFDLILLDNLGREPGETDYAAAGQVNGVVARSLIVEGGRAPSVALALNQKVLAANGTWYVAADVASTNTDSLTLQEGGSAVGGDDGLDTALELIDLSGYNGTFTAGQVGTTGTDIKIIVNAYDLNWTLAADGAGALATAAVGQLDNATGDFADGATLGATASYAAGDVMTLTVEFNDFEGNLQTVTLTTAVTAASVTAAGAAAAGEENEAFAALFDGLSAISANGHHKVEVSYDANTGEIAAAITANTVAAAQGLGAVWVDADFGKGAEGGGTAIVAASIAADTANANGANFGGAATNSYNTIFEFTGDATTVNPAVWTINNFISAADGNFNNHTILDVSDLGISNYAQLQVEYDVFNNLTVITSETQSLTGDETWAIVLTGGDYVASLGVSENFIFA